MAIISSPQYLVFGGSIHCIVCNQRLILENAAVGAIFANGQQAFACNSHFWDSPRLICGWAKFIYEQYILFRKQNVIFNEGRDEPALY